MEATRLLSATTLILLTSLLGAGCVGPGPGGSDTALIKATESEATASEYRAAANSLAIRVPGLVELTGNRMLDQTSDPGITKLALLWKIEGTAAFQQALFRQDPLGAAVETWTLAIQVQDAVETGALREAFGPLQPIARQGADSIRQTIDDESRAIVRRPERYAELREFVTRWAHDNPISLPFSTRPSIQPLLAQIASKQELGLAESLGSVTASVADLSTKLDIHVASLPKSLRWQAELATLDAATTDTGRQTRAVLERADALLSQKGVKELSDLALTSVRAERIAILDDIERQRVDAFDRMFKERLAVFEAIDAQRRATLADLDVKIDRSLQQVDAVANRILLRVGLAIGALMVLAALLAWLVGRSGAFRRSHGA